MGLLDDIIINAKSAATTVGAKAGQIKEYSKLKYSEAGIKGEITKKKQELGDYVYCCTKTGDVDNEKLQKMVDDISELEENLQITREMITVAKNKVVCGNCKAENEKNAAYCSKCGKKLEAEEAPAAEPTQETADDCGDVTVAAASSVDDVTCEAVDNADVDATVAEKDDLPDDEPAANVTEETAE